MIIAFSHTNSERHKQRELELHAARGSQVYEILLNEYLNVTAPAVSSAEPRLRSGLFGPG